MDRWRCLPCSGLRFRVSLTSDLSIFFLRGILVVEEMSFVLVDLLILGFLTLLLMDVFMCTTFICVHLLFFNVLIPFSTTDYDLASIFFIPVFSAIEYTFYCRLSFKFVFVCFTPRTGSSPVDCIHS